MESINIIEFLPVVLGQVQACPAPNPIQMALIVLLNGKSDRLFVNQGMEKRSHLYFLLKKRCDRITCLVSLLLYY